MTHHRWSILLFVVLCAFACKNGSGSDYFEEKQRSDVSDDPRPPAKQLALLDSFEVGGFTYGIDSVSRSDVDARFQTEESGELDWVTIHYRFVNTSDKPLAPIVPDVIVETGGLTFKDTGGTAKIGLDTVDQSEVHIGKLDEIHPGETELNMAIFKIPDEHADEIKATFDFDGYRLPTSIPNEYIFELQPEPGTQVLAEPLRESEYDPDARVDEESDDAGDNDAGE